MLGANTATRALMMPEQVSSPKMQAVERSLDCLPTTLNVGAAQTNSLPGCTAIISRRAFGEISTPDFR